MDLPKLSAEAEGLWRREVELYFEGGQRDCVYS